MCSSRGAWPTRRHPCRDVAARPAAPNGLAPSAAFRRLTPALVRQQTRARWPRGPHRRTRRAQVDDWGWDASVGYGLSDTGLPGLLTPFAKVDLASAYRRGARVGARFEAGGNLVRFLSVEVSAGQTYHFFDDSMAGVVELRGELRF